MNSVYYGWHLHPPLIDSPLCPAWQGEWGLALIAFDEGGSRLTICVSVWRLDWKSTGSVVPKIVVSRLEDGVAIAVVWDGV